MKGYPLIYSRTKYFDFVPDFLVRPNDIDVTNSLKYVQNTLMNIDLLDGIRYSVFSVGGLYICIGISCISKKLVQLLNKDSNASVNKAAEPYLKDVKGRNIASFIGVAIPSTEIKNGVIPSISLKEYLDIYIEYLSHQWNSEAETESEKLTSPTLEIKAKKYDSLFMPDIEKVADKSVVKSYSYYQEKTLDYCIMNTRRDKNFSFISDISDRTEWRNLIFTSASITPELLRSLKSLESELEAKRDPDPSDGEVSIKRNTAYRENNIQTQDGDIRIRTTQQQPQQAQKKNQKFRQHSNNSYDNSSHFNNISISTYAKVNTNDIENTIINILKNNHVRSFPANNGLMRYFVAPKSSFYNGLKHYAFELINDNSNSQYITQITFTIESGTIHILMKE